MKSVSVTPVILSHNVVRHCGTCSSKIGRKLKGYISNVGLEYRWNMKEVWRSNLKMLVLVNLTLKKENLMMELILLLRNLRH